MAQQTAVEWLVEQFEKNGYLGIQRIEQAIQMEKKQIVNSFIKGFGEGVVVGAVTTYKHQTAEQYYKETYGK